MSIGYRIFVVHDDHTVEPISQKSFSAFYLRNEPSLTRFADKSISLAIVFYELRNRKPERIFRIDTQRLNVTADGSLDQERSNDAIRLALNRSGGPFASRAGTKVPGPVTDATTRFDERRWARYYPQLSGPALGHILRALFGSATQS